jgi:hypothetical protein
MPGIQAAARWWSERLRESVRRINQKHPGPVTDDMVDRWEDELVNQLVVSFRSGRVEWRDSDPRWGASSRTQIASEKGLFAEAVAAGNKTGIRESVLRALLPRATTVIAPGRVVVTLGDETALIITGEEPENAGERGALPWACP